MKTFREYVEERNAKLNEASIYDGLLGTLASKNPTILRNMPGSIFAKAEPRASTKEDGMTAPAFEYERAVDMYQRLGGDGKKSIPYPGMPGLWLHPNGIVSPELPSGKEQQPIFDPYEEGGFGTVDTKVER